jgi:hypothetical protein
VSCLNRQNLDVTDGEAQGAARRSLGISGWHDLEFGVFRSPHERLGLGNGVQIPTIVSSSTSATDDKNVTRGHCYLSMVNIVQDRIAKRVIEWQVPYQPSHQPPLL